MWVMFLIMNFHGELYTGYSNATTAVPVTVITQEFTSKATCVNAVTEAKKSKKLTVLGVFKSN